MPIHIGISISSKGFTLICSRCGTEGIADSLSQCPNCGFDLKPNVKLTASTGTFRALNARRKMLTQRQFSLPFALGERIFNRFLVKDLLGQGPTAVVYQVQELTANAQGQKAEFVLKWIHQRWQNEINLDHFKATILNPLLKQIPNLNAAVEVIEGEGFGILTHLQAGVSLRKIIQLRQNSETKLFNLKEVLSLFTSLVETIKVLHQNQLVHGNIKPENIFLIQDDQSHLQAHQLSLGDPCLSQAIGFERFVNSQSTAGQSQYIAPELSLGQISKQTDLYNLGILCYELLTGTSGQNRRKLGDVLKVAGLDRLDQWIEKSCQQNAAQRFANINLAFTEFQLICDELLSSENSPFNQGNTQAKEDTLIPPAIAIDAYDDEDDPFVATPQPVMNKNRTLPPSFSQSLGGVTSPFYPQMPSKAPSAINAPVEALKVKNQIPVTQPLFSPELTPTPRFDAISQMQASPLPTKPTFLDLGLANPQDQSNLNLSSEPLKTTQYVKKSFLESNLGFLISAILVVAVAASIVFVILNQKTKDQKNQKTEIAKEISKIQQDQSIAVAPIQPLDQGIVMPKPLDMLLTSVQTPNAADELRAQAEKIKAQAEADRLKVEAEANRLKAEAEMLEAKRLKDEADKLKAEADKLKAEDAKKVKAEADKLKAEADKLKAEADQAKAQALKAEADQAKAEKVLKQSTQEIIQNTTADPQAAIIEGESSDERVFCPKGMLVVVTAAFPNKSIRGNRIEGKEAVILAKEGKAFCIDMYEFPGGGQPKVNVTLDGARALCSQNKKRLCSDREWRTACVGKGGAPYPYGRSFDPTKCNTEDEEEEERKLGSVGQFKSCRSAAGIFDMSGNVSEWTEESIVRGGDYTSSDDDASCNAGGKRAPSTQKNSIGFRCCSELK
jgi:serine/threonine protein kinase